MIFFTASWSAPGRIMKPVIEKIAREYGLTLSSYDVGKNPEIAGRFGLNVLPVLRLVRGEQILRQWSGAIGGYDIRRGVEEVWEVW